MRVAVLVVSGMLLIAVPAIQADPILIQSGGVAQGINGLLVDGMEYDVSFRTGSYSDIFLLDPPTFMLPFSIPNANSLSNTARQAAQGITSLLTAGGIAYVGDGSSFGRSFSIPFIIYPGLSSPILGIFSENWGNTASYAPSLWVTDGGAPSFNTFEGQGRFAVFQQASVPEPTILWIFALGLPALLILRRRRMT